MHMRTIGFLALPLALTACTTSQDSYPSLLPRPVEAANMDEPIRPDPVATPDAALDARIAEALADAQKVAVRFNALAQESEAKVAIARGVAPGSERWIAAQMSIANLSRARGESVTLASALEVTAAEHLREGKPHYPKLNAAIATLAQQVAEQSKRVQALDIALEN